MVVEYYLTGAEDERNMDRERIEAIKSAINGKCESAVTLVVLSLILGCHFDAVPIWDGFLLRGLMSCPDVSQCRS